MEKKRKLPARAAARVEQVSKRRTVTPPENRSSTPAPPPVPVLEEQAPTHSLPKSIQTGRPLPTVEEPQPEDLPSKEYQTVQESGVLAESLHRSRQKWISEGIFEKYWTKPVKRRGVVVEEFNNPSKDTMTKLGQVTITIEPHVFEATMFGVKELKPSVPSFLLSAASRPVIQYGPPNGTMPPPATPTPAPTSQPSTPGAGKPQTPTSTSTVGPAHAQQPRAQDTEQVPPSRTPDPSRPEGSPQPISSAPLEGPGTSAQQPVGAAELQAPSADTPAPSQAPTPTAPASAPASAPVSAPAPAPAPAPAAAATVTQPPAAPVPSASPSLQPTPRERAPAAPAAGSSAPRPGSAGPGAARPASTPQAGTDPIIVTLAERATEDPMLRDLMKRVASGVAPKDELERFQAIIEQITAESRRKGSQQGPSADRLLVEGRTVRYFAEEVRAILSIVLSSNPKQTSADLRPPAGSDPLVVLLVKTALDDLQVRDTVRRIAENRPQFSDATDLKAVLDRLKNRLARDQERQRTQSPSGLPAPAAPKANGVTNGSATPSGSVPVQAKPPPPPQQQQAPPSQTPPQQALRSKGPPPPPKPDISAVVFEFAGGTGDRFLFPKFSILEYISGAQGQQVIASFLIVRRGSTFEYGGNPDLDYYQPVTIRLSASNHRHLESLARVVAPPDEVKRYMDDVMSNMTRAEYVLLAMRLPKKEEREAAAAEREREKEAAAMAEAAPSGELQIRLVQQVPGVLWTTRASAAPPPLGVANRNVDEDEQYQNFIASVTPQKPGDV